MRASSANTIKANWPRFRAECRESSRVIYAIGAAGRHTGCTSGEIGHSQPQLAMSDPGDLSVRSPEQACQHRDVQPRPLLWGVELSFLRVQEAARRQARAQQAYPWLQQARFTLCPLRLQLLEESSPLPAGCGPGRSRLTLACISHHFCFERGSPSSNCRRDWDSGSF